MHNLVKVLNEYYCKKLKLLDTNKYTVIEGLRADESIVKILLKLEKTFNSSIICESLFEVTQFAANVNLDFYKFLEIIDLNKAFAISLILSDMKTYDIVTKLNMECGRYSSSPTSLLTEFTTLDVSDSGSTLNVNDLFLPLDEIDKGK